MSDRISSPEHYTYSEYEPKDVIYAWNLNFYLGNVVKYICRAGRKENSTKLEDLKKARQYIDFEIEKLSESEKRNGFLFTRSESSPITEEDLREAYLDDGK